MVTETTKVFGTAAFRTLEGLIRETLIILLSIKPQHISKH